MNSMANSQIDIKRLSFPNADAQLLLGLKGDKGDTGDNGDKGDTGDTGNGIASITHTGTSGAVKTYTITFTDGTSQTYDVTDGQVTTEQMDTAIDNAVTDVKSDLSAPTRNLFNKKAVTAGLINRDTAVIAGNADYSTSDYIPVANGETYYISNFNQWYGCFFNTSKVFVSHITTSGSPAKFVAPADGYIRVGIANVNLDIGQIEKGTSSTRYIPYVTATDYEAREDIDNLDTEAMSRIEDLEDWTEVVPARALSVDITGGTTAVVAFPVYAGRTYVFESTTTSTVSVNTYNGSALVETLASGFNPSYGLRSVPASDATHLRFWSANSGTMSVKELNTEYFRNSERYIYRDAVDALVNSRHKNDNTESVLTLLHFSDIHGDKGNLRRLCSFAEMNAKNIDDIICTGDIKSASFADSLSFWEDTDYAKNILTCMGNHDSYSENTMDPTKMVTMSTLANEFIVPFESNWGSITRTSGCTYYYKDYYSKFRLIVYDSVRIGAESDAEGAWLTSVLADALANNLGVIIAMHYMPTGYMNVFDCQFSEFGMVGETTRLLDFPEYPVEEAVQNFINNGGKFYCYLTGHWHKDLFGHPKNYPDQPLLLIGTASVYIAQQSVIEKMDVSRLSDGKNLDLFNLVTFDYGNDAIKVIRVGSDTDFLLRPRKYMTYDISNKKFITGNF